MHHIQQTHINRSTSWSWALTGPGGDGQGEQEGRTSAETIQVKLTVNSNNVRSYNVQYTLVSERFFYSPYLSPSLTCGAHGVPEDADAWRTCRKEQRGYVLEGGQRNIWWERLTCSQHLHLSPFHQLLHTAKLQVVLVVPGVVLDTLGHLTHCCHCPWSATWAQTQRTVTCNCNELQSAKITTVCIFFRIEMMMIKNTKHFLFAEHLKEAPHCENDCSRIFYYIVLIFVQRNRVKS